MKATVEISMYPLKDTYEQEIIDFILKLRAQPGIEVMTNGISTQLFGDYETLMTALNSEMKEVLEHSRAVFVLKIAKGERTPDSIPSGLRS